MNLQHRDSSPSRSSRRLLRTALAAAALAGALAAQAPIDPSGWYGGARRTLVRDAAYLYSVTVDPGPSNAGEVRLWRRDVAPGSPWSLFLPSVNDATSGVSAAQPANEVSLAITSDGCLHVTWAQAYYQSFYRQYYRPVPTDGHSPGSLIQLSADPLVVGSGSSPNSRKTDSFDIVASYYIESFFPSPTQRPRVFVCAQGSTNWCNRLIEIRPVINGGVPDWGQPPLLRDAGMIPVTGSSQATRLAVDAAGRVHAAYYSNGVPGVAHRCCTPWMNNIIASGTSLFSWSVETPLGSGTNHTDTSIDITAAPNGDVHVLYNHWTSAGTSQLVHRRLPNGALPWQGPNNAYVPPAGIASLDHRFAIVAAANGRVFAVRPDAQDTLWVDELTPGGSFQPMYELRGAGSPAIDRPSPQGTLWPVSNRLQCDLHVALRAPASTPGQALCESVDTCPYATEDPQCSYEGRIFFEGDLAAHQLIIGLEAADTGTVAVLLIGTSPTWLVVAPLCNCPLLVMPIVDFVMTGPGRLHVPLTLPASLGLTLYAQWAELGPTGVCGPHQGLSNLGTVFVP
ncbi:MAG TPA: hypothetical protein VFZ65_03950 [Planctomycetota bacterium]|nr:hypothetical protein [Planctomycetota bacterium]